MKCVFYSSSLGLRSYPMSRWVTQCKMNPHIFTPSYHHKGMAKVISVLKTPENQLLSHFFCEIKTETTLLSVSSGRKKLRLYEYLHEALNDPNMGDSIQWTDSGSGTFHFISKNKEKLAECWGQRKGNRKTMTYQKMARALRNYSRTGEIIKVRRKLTYQFNPDILHRLGSAHVPMHLPRHLPQEEAHTQQHNPSEQSYCGSAAADWHSWYAHYQPHEDYDLATSFTSHTKLWGGGEFSGCQGFQRLTYFRYMLDPGCKMY